MEGFQKTSSRAQFHRNPRHVSTSILLEWLYKLQLRFLFFWWYLPFQWSFSFGFEISFVTVSVYWMMSCVVKNPNVQRCSVHAMVFELGPYSLALMHIQSGHYVVVLQMRCWWMNSWPRSSVYQKIVFSVFLVPQNMDHTIIHLFLPASTLLTHYSVSQPTRKLCMVITLSYTSLDTERRTTYKIITAHIHSQALYLLRLFAQWTGIHLIWTATEFLTSATGR